LIFSFYASAQHIKYAPYSAYEIVILKEKSSGYSRSLGEIGIGVREETNLNNMSPASYAFINTVIQISEVSIIYKMDQFSTSDLTQRSVDGNLTVFI
jgi:hypothetical protein